MSPLNFDMNSIIDPKGNEYFSKNDLLLLLYKLLSKGGTIKEVIDLIENSVLKEENKDEKR